MRTLQRIGEFLRARYPGPKGVGTSKGWQYPIQDLEALGRAHAVNPWVHACVERIAQMVASLPLRIYRETGAGANVKREEQFNHPLVDLLWNPGRFLSHQQLIYRTAADLSLLGEFWWFIDNGKDAQQLIGEPKEIRPLSPAGMSVLPDRQNVVAQYQYRMLGEQVNFAPEFITRGMTYNPDDDYRGLSPMHVARSPVLMEYYLARYNTVYFRNSARPEGVVTTDQPLAKESRDANLEAWKQAFGGFDKAHGVAFMDRGAKYVPITTTAKDGEFLGLDKLSREQILAIFNVPPCMVGVFEYANYANSSQQLKMFMRHTISPICSLIEDAINSQLIPVWYRQDKGLYVEFDLSEASAIPEDDRTVATTRMIYVRSGIKTVNDVRREMNLPPLDWGDDPPAPSLPPSGDVALTNAAGKRNKGSLQPTRADQWAAMDRLALIGERDFRAAIRAFLQGQRDRILAAINGERGVRAMNADDLFDSAEENGRLKMIYKTELEKIITTSGRAALKRVGVAAEFNPGDPLVLEHLAHKALRVSGVNSETKEMLRDVLMAATEAGETTQQIASDVREMFDDMERWRSDRIARTEVVGANNAGALAGYAQSGLVRQKEWVATMDAVTRDSHAELDHAVVPMEIPFDNGLMFPGDDGPPEEVCNCRCTVIPVLDEETDE